MATRSGGTGITPNGLLLDAEGKLITTPRPPVILGSYGLGMSSGLLTLVEAAHATDGHIFSARWGSTTKFALITRLALSWRQITAFTAAQEIGLEAFIARTFTASYSGGTAATLTGNSFKKRSSFDTTAFTDIRIGSTGKLTAGTQTLDGNAFLVGGAYELAAAAADVAGHGGFDCEFTADLVGRHPIVLSQDTGIIVRNLILMGTAGTARVRVNMDWHEVDAW